MGICIHLLISKSVTKEEWKKVYDETLEIAKKFPLADLDTVKIGATEVRCLTPVSERTEIIRRTESYRNGNWFEKVETETGWRAVGDYENLKTGEEYFLPKDITDGNAPDPDAGDAMRDLCDSVLESDEIEVHNAYHLWGNKTQGESYHMMLLAIAALIEMRLGDKAFTYGDITRGQFRKAVSVARKYGAIDDPYFKIPNSCYPEELLPRINKLPYSEMNKLKLLRRFYRGAINDEFGYFVRTNFSEKSIDSYWQEEFKDLRIGSIGFSKAFKEYLRCGYDLRKLCDHAVLQDDEGSHYEEFIKYVMKAELHKAEKDCRDFFELDMEAPFCYNVAAQMASVFYGGCYNPRVDQYIPLPEIRKILNGKFGEKCRVDDVIDSCLEEERAGNESDLIEREILNGNSITHVSTDMTADLNESITNRIGQLRDECEKYDIFDFDGLLHYIPGSKIKPDVLKSLEYLIKKTEPMKDEPEYIELRKKDPEERFDILARAQHFTWLRDRDFRKIREDILTNGSSFFRYYSLERFNLGQEEIQRMCMALMINDDLYQYCVGSADQKL